MCQPPAVPATSARHRSVLNFRLCCSCSWLHNSWSFWVLLWGVHTRIGRPTSKILIGHTWTPRMELWQTWFGHCLRISSQHSSSQTLFYACTLAQTALPFCQSCIGISGASGALQATTLMSNPRPMSRRGITKNADSYYIYHIIIIIWNNVGPTASFFRVPHQFCCCISKYIGPVGPNISTVRPSMMASLSWEAASALIFSDPPKSLQDVARWCLGGMTCMTFLSGSCWFWGEDSDYPIWIVRICSNMFKPYESRNVTNVTLLSIFVDYYAACRLSIHQSGQFLSIWEVLRGDNLLQQINFCCPL